jgi:ArsR family transcriptional regulator, virulence genes transcriptional regulator
MKNTFAKAILNRCDDVSSVLKSLSHPIRLKVLCHIMEEEKSVNDLTEFCKISQSAMSQFLGRMKEEGVLTSRRDAQRILYSLADTKLRKLLHALKEIYCS